VDLLANAGTLPRQVRFVLTSRPEKAVLRHFEERQIPLIRLDASRSEDQLDIRRYIKGQLADSESLHARLVEHDLTSDDFIERVSVASQGNFLCLVLLLPAVAAGTQRFDTPEDLPQGLDEIYREFMRNRKTRDEDRWRKICEPILGVLAVAKVPLTRLLLSKFTNLTAQEVRYGL
jgi:hypothetical protein